MQNLWKEFSYKESWNRRQNINLFNIINRINYSRDGSRFFSLANLIESKAEEAKQILFVRREKMFDGFCMLTF